MKTPSLRNRGLRALCAALLLLGAAGCGGAEPEAPASRAPNAAAVSGDAGPADPEAKPFEGFRAPEIVARDVLSGETVRLSAFRGKVVMLNFWATWCPPCREEMPAMEQFHRESQGQVQVVAVAADGSEAPEALEAFATELGLSFPVLYDGGLSGVTYRAFGLPTTLFLDAEGIVRIRVSGPMTREQMAELAARAAELGEQAAEPIEETKG